MIILQFNTLDIVSLSLQEGSKTLLLDQITTKINNSCLCKIGESIRYDFFQRAEHQDWNFHHSKHFSLVNSPIMYYPHSNPYKCLHTYKAKCNDIEASVTNQTKILSRLEVIPNDTQERILQIFCLIICVFIHSCCDLAFTCLHHLSFSNKGRMQAQVKQKLFIFSCFRMFNLYLHCECPFPETATIIV